MKFNLITILIFISFIYSSPAKSYKPYIIGAESDKSIKELVEPLKNSLTKNGLNITGSYVPANDEKRMVITITSDELIEAVGKFGGIRAFAAGLRVALTKEDGKTLITYTNPSYWGNAYFQDDYPSVKSVYNGLAKSLRNSMKGLGSEVNREYGSEDGIDDEDLRDYHYMMFMPYFEDVVELAEFKTYNDAVKTIDDNLKKGGKTKKVYKISIPGKKLTLYGIELSGETGESEFLPVIDIDKPLHTCFLPYEMLVMDNQVVMLHGRFRIAVSFPDLGMGTFTKIMSTPGDIEDLMKSLTE